MTQPDDRARALTDEMRAAIQEAIRQRLYNRLKHEPSQAQLSGVVEATFAGIEKSHWQDGLSVETALLAIEAATRTQAERCEKLEAALERIIDHAQTYAIETRIRLQHPSNEQMLNDIDADVAAARAALSKPEGEG